MILFHLFLRKIWTISISHFFSSSQDHIICHVVSQDHRDHHDMTQYHIDHRIMSVLNDTYI